MTTGYKFNHIFFSDNHQSIYIVAEKGTDVHPKKKPVIKTHLCSADAAISKDYQALCKHTQTKEKSFLNFLSFIFTGKSKQESQ